MEQKPQTAKPVLTMKTDTNKESANIPVLSCRENFSLDEACSFVDEISVVLLSLCDLSNLTALHRTVRQLSRTFTMCTEIRPQLTEHMIEIGLPGQLVRLIKRLNNMGVFSNDGTWYSSFYLYTIVWNYSEISPEFSTAVAVAAISQLLNLNVGHAPYLANIESKNVYFLIKASLSILHNIVKVPGNRDMGQHKVGRDALLNILTLPGENTLRCLAAVCLAHTLNDEDVEMAEARGSEHPSLLQLLLGYLFSAGASTKRQHHGVSLLDLMTALCAFAVNQSVQTSILASTVEPTTKPGRPPSRSSKTLSCIDYILKLTNTYLSAESSKEEEREANAAIRIIYHLVFNRGLANESKMKICMRQMLDLSRYPTVLERPDKALSRVLETMLWQSTQRQCEQKMEIYELPDPNTCGPIVMNYSPANEPAVAYFMEQLRAAGLPIWNDVDYMGITHGSAQDVGLSALAGTVGDHKTWLQCVSQATVMIACLSDAYRQNPGCRSEIEYFINTNSANEPKVLIYILMPPKFQVNGWVSRLPGVEDAIDFTHKRTFVDNLQLLVSRAGQPYGITVANEPLDPLDLDDDDQKSYLGLDRLAALKTSSIFMTSSESDLSKNSVIAHTAEQMLTKGSIRPATLSTEPNLHSNTTTPHSVESGDHSPLYHSEVSAVESIPSTYISELHQKEAGSKELGSPSLPISPDQQDENDIMLQQDAGTLSPQPDDPKRTVSRELMEALHVSKDDETIPAVDVPMVEQEGASPEDIAKPEGSQLYEGEHLQAPKGSNEGSIEPAESTHTQQTLESHSLTKLVYSEKIEESHVSVTKNTVSGTMGQPHDSDGKALAPLEENKIEQNEHGDPNMMLNDSPKAIPQQLDQQNLDPSNTSSPRSQQEPEVVHEVPLEETLVESTRSSVKQQSVSRESHGKSSSATRSKSLGLSAKAQKNKPVPDSETEDRKSNKEIGTQELAQLAQEPVNQPIVPAEEEKTETASVVGRNKEHKTHVRLVTNAHPASNDLHEDPVDKTSNTLTEKNTAENMGQPSPPEDLPSTQNSQKSQTSGDKKKHLVYESGVQTQPSVDNDKSPPMFESNMDRNSLPIPSLSEQIDRIQGTSLILNGSHEDIVEQHVRNWTAAQVNEWLLSKGLPHLSHKLCGGLDGVVLSQLVYLRHWAPEYFAKSIRSELGLGFVEGLRLVEAMEELTKKPK